MNPLFLFPVMWLFANLIYTFVLYFYLKDRLYKERYVAVLRVSLISLWMISLAFLGFIFFVIL